MKLKKTVYETRGMVVGTITMEEDKVRYAEIIDCTIFDLDELAKMRVFLDEVEKAMSSHELVDEVEDIVTYTATLSIGEDEQCEQTKADVDKSFANIEWGEDFRRSTVLNRVEVKEKTCLECVNCTRGTVNVSD